MADIDVQGVSTYPARHRPFICRPSQSTQFGMKGKGTIPLAQLAESQCLQFCLSLRPITRAADTSGSTVTFTATAAWTRHAGRQRRFALSVVIIPSACARSTAESSLIMASARFTFKRIIATNTNSIYHPVQILLAALPAAVLRQHPQAVLTRLPRFEGPRSLPLDDGGSCRLRFMWLHPRLEIQGPQFPAEHREGFEPIRWFTAWIGHSGDEYGNCAFQCDTALLGGFTIFWDPHFQRDVEVPRDSDATAADWQRWYDRKFNGEYSVPDSNRRSSG